MKSLNLNCCAYGPGKSNAPLDYTKKQKRFQDIVRQSLMTESYNACVSVAEIMSNGFYIK